MAFTTLQTRLFFPTSSLLGVQADVQASLALFDRVFEYLDLPVDIDEKPDAIDDRPRELRGELRFRDVAFAYDDDRQTLEHVSFTARPGMRVAVVGETGSGKTTLGYLAARLYDPTGGASSSTARPARPLVRHPHVGHRRRLPGDVPVPRHGAREPALRPARGDRRGARAGGPRGPDPRAPGVAAGRLRHDR